MFKIVNVVTKVVIEGEYFKGVTIFVPKDVLYRNCNFNGCKILYKEEDHELTNFAELCYFEDSETIPY